LLNDQKPRRVVPRWRSSLLTSTTPESKSTKKANLSIDFQSSISIELKAKSKEFELYKSVPIASELMFLASVTGNQEAARLAAQTILDNQEKISSSQLLSSAHLILNDDSPEQLIINSRDFVKKARSLLRIDYKNPVLLMDVARELTSMRHEKSALRYVKAALSLAPKSRFVTRSAARYYLHIGEYDFAHDLLKKSPLLKGDPWIQASEIAVSTVKGNTSVFVKQLSKSFKKNQASGVELSELASALGTVEFLSGDEKAAKFFFKQALNNPNDNSLAQIEWVAQRLKLIVDERILETPFSFEANSSNAYRRQEIDKAVFFAQKWAEDEPFASRPIDAQSYFLTLQGKYSEALEVATKSYEIDRTLLKQLNLLFLKIQSGNLEDSIEEFQGMRNHPNWGDCAIQYYANGGALAYALGEFEQGRKMYQKAIQLARNRSEPHLEGLARAFFARVSTVAGDELSSHIIQESAEIVPRLPSLGAIYIMQQLVDLPKYEELKRLTSARMAKRKWKWDQNLNIMSIFD
jgi:tetratricopeptide (TPR) repeat protein